MKKEKKKLERKLNQISINLTLKNKYMTIIFFYFSTYTRILDFYIDITLVSKKKKIILNYIILNIYILAIYSYNINKVKFSHIIIMLSLFKDAIMPNTYSL